MWGASQLNMNHKWHIFEIIVLSPWENKQFNILEKKHITVIFSLGCHCREKDIMKTVFYYHKCYSRFKNDKSNPKLDILKTYHLRSICGYYNSVISIMQAVIAYWYINAVSFPWSKDTHQIDLSMSLPPLVAKVGNQLWDKPAFCSQAASALVLPQGWTALWELQSIYRNPVYAFNPNLSPHCPFYAILPGATQSGPRNKN